MSNNLSYSLFSYVISHTLDLKVGKADTSTLDINIDPVYFLLFLTVIFTFILFLACLFKQKLIPFLKELHRERIENFYEITNCYLKANLIIISNYQLLSICFILYSVYALSCFHKLFVLNSFLTSNVLINTEKIITTSEKLLKSDRKLCYFYLSETHSLITKAPEKSLFRRVLKDKSFDPSCLFDTHILDINVDHLKNYERQGFLITSYSFALVVINIFISHSGSPYWISGQFFAYNHCHLLRRR